MVFKNATWKPADEQRSRQFESIWTSLVQGTDVKCCVGFSRACVVKIQKFPEVWFTCDFLTLVLSYSSSKAESGVLAAAA